MKSFGNGGSVVVEAVIIFPLVIIVLFAMFSLAFSLAQLNSLQTAAQTAALLCAQQMRDTSFNRLFTGDLGQRIELLDNNYLKPYRYLVGSETNKKAIYKAISMLVPQGILQQSSKMNIIITAEHDLMSYVYTVKITQTFKYPINLSLLGLSNSFQISATGKAIVTDAVELIRNTDIALQTAQDLGATAEIKKMFQKVKKYIMIDSNA